MAEYIEREEVYEMLHALGGCGADPDTWADGWDKAIDTAIEELDDIPAADVRPERHGEWLWINDKFYECSECGAFDSTKRPYCWKCGAKMDGKEHSNG